MDILIDYNLPKSQNDATDKRLSALWFLILFFQIPIIENEK